MVGLDYIFRARDRGKLNVLVDEPQDVAFAGSKSKSACLAFDIDKSFDGNESLVAKILAKGFDVSYPSNFRGCAMDKSFKISKPY